MDFIEKWWNIRQMLEKYTWKSSFVIIYIIYLLIISIEFKIVFSQLLTNDVHIIYFVFSYKCFNLQEKHILGDRIKLLAVQ